MKSDESGSRNFVLKELGYGRAMQAAVADLPLKMPSA